MTPVSVNYGLSPGARTAQGNLLAFNDFHGSIDPPTGSGAAVNGVPAGGSEYLTIYLDCWGGGLTCESLDRPRLEKAASALLAASMAVTRGE